MGEIKTGKKIKIAPSILAADFAHMGDEVKKISECGADMIHIDIMDGVFVSNISFGPQMVKAIRPYTSTFFDVHLMLGDPYFYLQNFIDAGADGITFHLESSSDIKKTIEYLKEKNIRSGLAIRPKTDICDLFPYMEMIDMVLVMTVEPGYGGQKFIPDCLQKVESLKGLLIKQNLDHIDIEVDGGINRENITEIKKAGANVIVAGTSIFKASDIKDEIFFFGREI